MFSPSLRFVKYDANCIVRAKDPEPPTRGNFQVPQKSVKDFAVREKTAQFVFLVESKLSSSLEVNPSPGQEGGRNLCSYFGAEHLWPTFVSFPMPIDFSPLSQAAYCILSYALGWDLS